MQILLAKGWDTILDNAPKFKRDWGPPEPRTKTAPAPKTQRKPRERPKPKTAGKKPGSITNENGFEDFVFETPPVTPEPERVPLKPVNKRDSEFWDFYEKGNT